MTFWDRLFAVAFLGCLIGLFISEAHSLRDRLNQAFQVRLADDRLILLQPAVGPQGQPGMIGETPRQNKEGGVRSEHNGADDSGRIGPVPLPGRHSLHSSIRASQI